MSRKIDISINEYYHVYSRGVDKRIIFLENADRDRFIKLLYLCNGTQSLSYQKVFNKDLSEIDVGEKMVSIGAYCFMQNHFHILIKEIKEKGITEFLRKLLTAYSMYFNKKYQRTGTLFDGAYKAKHLDTDEYLKYIFAYIHLNPVKNIDPSWKENGISDIEKAKRYLFENKYSSYLDYLGIDREENIILNKTDFPEYFENRQDFTKYLDDWINYKHLIEV